MWYMFSSAVYYGIGDTFLAKGAEYASLRGSLGLIAINSPSTQLHFHLWGLGKWASSAGQPQRGICASVPIP